MPTKFHVRPSYPISLWVGVAVVAVACTLLSSAGERTLGLCAFTLALLPGHARVLAAARVVSALLVTVTLAFILRTEARVLVGLAALLLSGHMLLLWREPIRRWASPRFLRALPRPTMERSLDARLTQALRAGADTRASLVDEAIAGLAHAAPGDVPEDEATRRALWINVYNVMVMHAARDRHSDAIDGVLDTFRIAYPMFGSMLTADQVEHGLLRNNARHSVGRPFSRSDPRLRWAVPLDHRVHFALNCAAASCPPIRVYQGADLDAQLDWAEEAFLTAETHVADHDGVVTSRILKWYGNDFPQPLTEYLARRLQQPDLANRTLRFAPYHWTNPNVAAHGES